MKNKRHDLRALVEFTSTERRIMQLILVAISIFMLGTLYVKNIYQGNPQLSREDYSRLADMLRDMSVDHKVEYAINMKEFDPNNIKEEELIEMGWPDRTSKTLVKFRDSGFRFESKEDLLKVIGIDSSFYELIEPWVTMESPHFGNTSQSSFIRDKHTEPVKPLKPFDPNTITAQELIAMGWDAKPAFTLVNYRKKIKNFQVKDDLKVIRGLTDSAYRAMAPFIMLPDSIFREIVPDTIRYYASRERIYKRHKRDTININQADTMRLVDLYGVGPYTAKLITRYRERLGGFYDKSQLYEIEWIEKERIDSIMPYVTVDDSYKRIDVKSQSFSELLGHPYLEYESVVELKNYFRKRPQREYLSSFIEKSRINSDTLALLRPYLTLPKEAQKSPK